MSSRLHLFALAIALLVSAAAPCFGQAASYTDHSARPDGVVAEITDELIAAINARDADAFIRFLDERAAEAFRNMAPAEEHAEVFQQVCRETGGLDYHGYRTYDPPRPADDHVIILKGRRTGSWHAFVFVMDADDPARFAGLQFAPARRPSNLPALPPLTIEQMADELDAHIDRLVEADAFSGTVLIAKGGRAIYERAVGLASKRFGAANDMDTKFNLGSMNKMFTAVAIAQLVEDGRLSLDDPLSSYVDESWLAPDVAGKIRIRHMLNHTSGPGSYFNDVFWESSRARFRALDDYKPLIVDETLAFEPGAGWQYSNTAFFLLGVVIEKVTGESYFDHVKQAVFVPAGMTNTDCYEMDRPVPNLAIGYIPEPAPGRRRGVAEQPVHARDQGRPRRGRVLHGAGSAPVRRRAAWRAAPFPRRCAKSSGSRGPRSNRRRTAMGSGSAAAPWADRSGTGAASPG